MNITEVLPEKKIVIKKFAFSCDDIDESIPKPLPQALNYFLLIAGKAGSGKTTLILNLLCKRGKNYNRKFDRVFIFSPSLNTLKEEPFSELPEDQKFQELDEEILEPIINVLLSPKTLLNPPSIDEDTPVTILLNPPNIEEKLPDKEFLAPPKIEPLHIAEEIALQQPPTIIP